MKDSLDQLAIFGGKPAFKEKLHVGGPNMGDRQRLLVRIASTLDRRWLTNDGPYVQQFEQGIVNLTGVKTLHCGLQRNDWYGDCRSSASTIGFAKDSVPRK
jgi:hypothetical protein